MVSPIKVFLEAVIGKNYEDEKEIKQAEKLGEIVSNNAEISIGIMNKIHIDADKARKAATEKSTRKSKRQENVYMSTLKNVDGTMLPVDFSTDEYDNVF